MTTAEILERQRKFFASGATRPESFRRDVLARLRRMLEEHEEDIQKALYEDLGKSPMESYMAEIGMVKSELGYMERHLHRLMKKRRAATPLAQFAASSYMVPEPYGNVLVRKGYLYRETGQKDRRVIYVRLTEKGRGAEAVHRKFHQKMVESLEDRLSDGEWDTLLRSLDALGTFFSTAAKGDDQDN